MSILIDGYNLLNAVGITGRGVGLGSLERSRLALLNFLAESLASDEIPNTTVVFDAANPPPGLPRVVDHRGLTVRFASQYDEADTLIEELIRAETVPRRLTVVSSDHRLQRAARRRRARAVDSDVWYAEVIQRLRQQRETGPEVPAKPGVPLLEEEVARWLERFGGEAALEAWVREQEAAAAPRVEGRSPEEASPEEPAPDKLSAEEAAAIGNPFPDGYAEELLEDDPLADLRNPFPPGYGEDLEEP